MSIEKHWTLKRVVWNDMNNWPIQSLRRRTCWDTMRTESKYWKAKTKQLQDEPLTLIRKGIYLIIKMAKYIRKRWPALDNRNVWQEVHLNLYSVVTNQIHLTVWHAVIPPTVNEISSSSRKETLSRWLCYWLHCFISIKDVSFFFILFRIPCILYSCSYSYCFHGFQ